MRDAVNEQKTPITFSNVFTRVIGSRLITGLFFVSALMVLFISIVVNRQMNRHIIMLTESTQNHMMASALALSKYITAEELDRYHTTEDTYTPEYQDIKNRLMRFADKFHVLYAYYWRDYGNGLGQHIVDNDTDPEEQVGPWNIFEIEKVALDGLAGNIGVTDLGTYTAEEWGGLISAYAPVFDKDGNFYCVAGVDISDEFIFIQRKDSRNMMIMQIIAISVSVFFGVLNTFLYRRKAIQIEEAHIRLQYFNNNLRRAFSTYIADDVVEEIVSDPTRLQLGGIKRHMTAMFTDVQGFTHIAETLSPERLVDLLNYYLSTMSDIILEQKGTIDKYEGDAIVAFFGAPIELRDHAVRACAAAIAMKRIETKINKYVLENGISPTPLLTRIGINSGEMTVGNMGTQIKMNYTIISNAVNMAARLEEANKFYGTWIIASENTIIETGERFLCRKLDRIKVTGIKEPVRIFEIMETMENASPEFYKKAALFHNAHSLFESRRWQDAEIAFKHVLEQFPADGPSAIYLGKCQEYQRNEPAADWDDVFDMSDK